MLFNMGRFNMATYMKFTSFMSSCLCFTCIYALIWNSVTAEILNLKNG
jgi:hypothetical protein